MWDVLYFELIFDKDSFDTKHDKHASANNEKK